MSDFFFIEDLKSGGGGHASSTCGRHHKFDKDKVWSVNRLLPWVAIYFFRSSMLYNNKTKCQTSLSSHRQSVRSKSYIYEYEQTLLKTSSKHFCPPPPKKKPNDNNEIKTTGFCTLKTPPYCSHSKHRSLIKIFWWRCIKICVTFCIYEHLQGS